MRIRPPTTAGLLLGGLAVLLCLGCSSVRDGPAKGASPTAPVAGRPGGVASPDEPPDEDRFPEAPAAWFDPQDEQDFLNFLQMHMEAAHLPGMAIALVKEDRILWTTALGWADLERQIPVTIDTLFSVGSLSKTVVVTALMQLWQQGRFALFQDINDFLPFSVRNPTHPDAPITFRELLTHSSSVADNADVLNALTAANEDCPIPLAEFLENYLTPGGAYYDADANFWDWRPGRRWKYSNVAVSLAGHLVEIISGVDYAEYCRQHVFAPLDMAQATYRLSDLAPGEAAVPYIYLPLARRFLRTPRDGFPFYPAGTLQASVTELAQLMMMYIGAGRYDGAQVLDPVAVEQIERVQYPMRWPNQGLVWYWVTYDDKDTLGHQGGGVGVLGKLFFSPSEGVGVALLANAGWDTIFEFAHVEIMMVELFRLTDRLSGVAELGGDAAATK
jgi:CubicO group peptidase (beta-lactamase class C family)